MSNREKSRSSFFFTKDSGNVPTLRISISAERAPTRMHHMCSEEPRPSMELPMQQAFNFSRNEKNVILQQKRWKRDSGSVESSHLSRVSHRVPIWRTARGCETAQKGNELTQRCVAGASRQRIAEVAWASSLTHKTSAHCTLNDAGDFSL